MFLMVVPRLLRFPGKEDLSVEQEHVFAKGQSASVLFKERLLRQLELHTLVVNLEMNRKNAALFGCTTG